MICPHCGTLIKWKNIDAALCKEILILHESGHSYRDIAVKTNVSFSAVGRVIRKMIDQNQKGSS